MRLDQFRAKQVRELKKENAALKALLKTLEFVMPRGKCPVCLGWNVSENGETPHAHTKDCALAAAIKSNLVPHTPSCRRIDTWTEEDCSLFCVHAVFHGAKVKK